VIIEKIRKDLVKYSENINTSDLQNKANKHLENKLNHQKISSNEIPDKINIIKEKNLKLMILIFLKQFQKTNTKPIQQTMKKNFMRLLERILKLKK
jgi:hypothetical protein